MVKTLKIILCFFLTAPILAIPDKSEPNYRALFNNVSKYEKCEAWCISVSFTVGATVALAAAVACAQGSPSPFAHLIENLN